MRAAVPHIDWRKLYEAAMLEMNPDKLAICIGAAEQAIAQQESSPDVTQLERRKLTDARSMLKSLSRIASEGQRKQRCKIALLATVPDAPRGRGNYLGSSARTETRSRRLATVTLLTFAQATVGLSALAQLPLPIVSHCFCCCVQRPSGMPCPLRFTRFLMRKRAKKKGCKPQHAHVKGSSCNVFEV